MLVVHGLWLYGGRLAIWAEDSERGAQPEKRRGRQPKRRSHTFAVDVFDLVRALGDAAKAASSSAAVLRLPTLCGVPVASPELGLVEAPTRSRATVALAEWTVPSCEYSRDDALAVLLGPPISDAVEGADLRHLRAVAAFAADLVARGRVLPTVEHDRSGQPDTWHARWTPLVTGVDAAWASALARAMPPSGRAEVPPEGQRPGARQEETATATLACAIDDLVDAAARAALGDSRLAGARRSTGMAETVRVWLAALSGRQRGFEADPDHASELVADVAEWQRDAAGGAVRACFRLVEPADEAARWHVEFALQAADEPSLVVAADQIWRSRGALRALARHLQEPQETLLAELGRAMRLWPELNSALRSARPAQMSLDTDGALRFLRDRAATLSAAGFGVLLPSWWGKPRARLGARLNARSAGSGEAPGTVVKPGGFGLDAIVSFSWQLALGDEVLSKEEMRALADAKSPLVRLRGQWVELDHHRLMAGLAHLTDGGQMTVGELLRAGLEDEQGPGGLPVVEVTADGPLGDLLAGRSEHRLAQVDAPRAFHGRLRPYQRRGLAWLSFLESLGLGGVLADDMGLGKTIQLLALMAGDERATKARAGKHSLLVCPMSLVGNWQREAARFAPDLRVHVHHGAERARGKDFAAAVRESDLVVTTYSLAARDAEDLGKIDWHRLVLDEAQAIKNAATRQATAVRGIPARHRLALTGTPVENRLADLWSIMEFANPGLLGTAKRFKRRYAEPVERHGDEEAAERLKRITGPFILRRLKTDTSIISDLPEKLEMEVLCNLTAEQGSLYQAVVDDMMAKIDESEGIERRGAILATMTKLKQVCNHPAQLLRDGTRLAGRSGKLARLEEILEEVMAAGERALLFTQYAEFGGMLRAHLGTTFDSEVLFLHGGVAKGDRDAMVRRFQEEQHGPALFVLSLKAGGTGLTLTAANHVIHVDRWWNPAVEDQATDRAFRIGQRKAVQVRKFVCAGTLEEKIATMIAEKRGLASKIVGTGEQWLTELSTTQLRELIALEAGAVVE